MEIWTYLSILRKRWWLLLFGFAAVFVLTLVLTLRQPPVYETRATFIIRPRPEVVVNDEFVRALDIVSRRVEINTTFAEVATSRLIKRQAVEELGLSTEQREGLAVAARVIGGTNVMEMTVEGRDPAIIRDFADAVGAKTVEYVSGLYDVFELEPLDSATIPARPSKPNIALNLAMGSMLGLALGASLVFLMHFLASAEQHGDTLNIIDRETGAYTSTYLHHRLWQETSRARRSRQPLSLALVRVGTEANGNDPANSVEAMHLTKTAMERLLRDEDVLARLDKNTFAILLPDSTLNRAKSLMGLVVSRIETLSGQMIGGISTRHVEAKVGIGQYEDPRQEPAQFLQEVLAALNGSESISLVGQTNGNAKSKRRNGSKSGRRTRNSQTGNTNGHQEPFDEPVEHEVEPELESEAAD